MQTQPIADSIKITNLVAQAITEPPRLITVDKTLSKYSELVELI